MNWIYVSFGVFWCAFCKFLKLPTGSFGDFRDPPIPQESVPKTQSIKTKIDT